MRKICTIACLFLFLFVGMIHAQTITDGSSAWQYNADITGVGSNGNVNFDAGNNIDQAYAADWYYAIGAGANSVNFPPPNNGNVTITGNTLVAFYPDLGGVVGLNATLTVILTEIGPLNVQVAQLMQLDNNTGSEIEIKLYNYLDLDKNDATTENAVLVLQDECNLITGVSNVSDPSQLCYFAVNAADGYEIDDYPNLVNSLVNGISGLSNSGLPLLADDYTQAYQFNGNVPSGGSLTGETLITFGVQPEAAVIDPASGQCTFPSTPAPEFTVGAPVESCNDDGTFTLTFAFSGEADGTEYTFVENDEASVSQVAIVDDGTVTEVVLGPYPYTSDWNVSVMGNFPGGAMPVFMGQSTCPPPFDCQDLMLDFGTACDDMDDCTTDDQITMDCECAGTFADADGDGVCDADDVCPDFDDALIGTMCEDGDACTTGDVYGMDCNCAGTFADADGDGVCDADDVCPAFDDALIGTDCDDGSDCTTGDIIGLDCVCTGTFADADGDGVCDADDVCPMFDDALIGTACDDADDCTTGDIYLADCNCAGVFADADGDGVCDADDVCPAFDDALIGTACDDMDACTEGDVYLADCNCAGVFADTDGDGVCDADDVCPAFDDALIGTACDDMDACTEGDVIGADCNCAGVFADADGDGVCDADDACPMLDDALIGTACDDGDVCTEGDVYLADCSCAGIFVDSDGDGVCDAEDQCPMFDDALIGTPCDDGDDCTINDVIGPNCECGGGLEIARVCKGNQLYVVDAANPPAPMPDNSFLIYSWYLDGNLVATITGSPYFSPTEIGVYTVEVLNTEIGGCTPYGSAISFTVAEVIDCTDCGSDD